MSSKVYIRALFKIPMDFASNDAFSFGIYIIKKSITVLFLVAIFCLYDECVILFIHYNLVSFWFLFSVFLLVK